MPNWRGSIIKEYLGEIPKLETVIKTDWFDESNEIKLPIYSAIARYFTLYMQNLGVLKKVYQSFSDHSRILTSRVNPRNQAIRLIELAFHKKITEIQVDFNIWLSEIIK